MGIFLRNGPCPKCNSKDNCAEYTENYYCWGCGYSKRKTDLHSIRERMIATPKYEKEVAGISTVSKLPMQAEKWLSKYSLTREDKAHFGWNEEKNFLVLYNSPQFWQARNFGNGSKYISQGKKPFITFGTGESLVFVEDVISAIKVGRITSSSPMWGSSILQEWQEGYRNSFKRVIIWPDKDKASQAVKTSLKLKAQGIDISVVVTEDDPKDYKTEDIRNYLTRYI